MRPCVPATKATPGSRAIDHRTGKLRFNRQVIVYQRLSLHLEIAIALFQDVHLNPELIARNDRMTESALIDARKINQLGIPVWIVNQQENDPNLSQGFNQEHPGHDGVLWEMALKMRLINSDVFKPDHMGGAVSFENAIDQQKRIALREYLKDLLDLLG
jgi:hypothetical protein